MNIQLGIKNEMNADSSLLCSVNALYCTKGNTKSLHKKVRSTKGKIAISARQFLSLFLYFNYMASGNILHGNWKGNKWSMVI